MNFLLEILNKNKIEFQENILLSKFSYLKTGGFAKLVIFPSTADEVALILKALKENSVKYKTIGATSNLLFLDNIVYNCLISTSKLKGIEINDEKSEITAEGGEMLADLSRFALNHSVLGFEGLEGIPGMVGGAVFMNAGAYGYEIKDVLKNIEIVDDEGVKKVIDKNALDLKYRNSALRNGNIKGIVTKCTFNITKGSQSEIEHRMELYHAKRHKYQDFMYPNLGSLYSGSIYRELGKEDAYFKVVSMLYFLFNYKLKLFRRESPINRKWINDIVVKRFDLNYDIQPFSNKGINCLVNRGQGTDEMLRYIEDINNLTKSRVRIENEIVAEF